MTHRAEESEFLTTPPEDRGSIEMGTVGWDVPGDHFDQNPGEPVLVKVTLFRGRRTEADGNTNKTGNLASGMRVVCTIGAPLNEIPPKGSRVYVIFPSGMGYAPGVGVIITRVQSQPANQFNDAKAKMDFGADVDLVLKARSITLTDYENRFITVGPDFGIKFGDANANGGVLKDGKWRFYTVDGSGNAKTTLQLADDWAGIVYQGSSAYSAVRLEDQKAWLIAPLATYMFSIGAYIGATATAATKALYGPPGAPIPSASVYLGV